MREAGKLVIAAVGYRFCYDMQSGLWKRTRGNGHTMTKPSTTRGRPRLQIDFTRVEKLAALGATDSEIAALIGISRRSLARIKQSPAYEQAYERGRARARTKLRRWQWRA